jgi:2,5-diketo-D-gluconate reductase B
MLQRAVNRLGLGTYTLTGEDGTKLITAAIEAGYRHIDTARLYGNEAEVGDAVEAASVAQEDIFVATKVAHFEEPEKTPDYVRTAVEESLDRLGVDSINLLYHHWPRSVEDLDTVLPVFQELYEEGVVDRIGVSNYRIEDVERAEELIDVPVTANQIEMHPLLQQDDLYEHCRERDITVVAYSPLAQGEVFDVPEIVDIAEKHDTTPALVSLAWLLSRDGVAAIPRSSSSDHIEENLDALGLKLDDEDLERIDALEETHRCEDPKWIEW